MQIKNKHPTHSIFSTSSEQFLVWRDNIIDDTFWNQTETKQIMCILNKIFHDVIHKLIQLLKSPTCNVDVCNDHKGYVSYYKLRLILNLYFTYTLLFVA